MQEKPIKPPKATLSLFDVSSIDCHKFSAFCGENKSYIIFLYKFYVAKKFHHSQTPGNPIPTPFTVTMITHINGQSIDIEKSRVGETVSGSACGKLYIGQS